MKHIKNVLTVLTLLAILSTDAKQVGKKTITNEPQPKPTPTPYVQPTPKPLPQPAPYYPQPQTGPSYENIYDLLRKKTPNSSDFSMLNNIIHEAEKQIQQIQTANLMRATTSVERKPSQQPTPIINSNSPDYPLQLKMYAGKLVHQYQTSLKISDFQIKNAYQYDQDIFLQKDKDEQYDAIARIVRHFVAQFPNVDKQTTVETILRAITLHENFIQLSEQITKVLGKNSEKMIKEVRQDIIKMIGSAWDDL